CRQSANRARRLRPQHTRRWQHHTSSHDTGRWSCWCPGIRIGRWKAAFRDARIDSQAQNIFLGTGERAASRPGFVAQRSDCLVCKTSSRDTNNCENPTLPHRNAAKGSFATCAAVPDPLRERRSIPYPNLAAILVEGHLIVIPERRGAV